VTINRPQRISVRATLTVGRKGVITGLLLGLLLTATPRLIHQPRINLAAGILFAILVILPW
jgi:hypothetical protein